MAWLIAAKFPMDLKALEYTRSHYDRHSNQYASTEEALKARASGPGAPLKKFHNDIKRQLINRFASNAGSLLDFACGRGGDIWKWIDAGIPHVKGVDLSPGEIEEARKRFSEAAAKRRGLQLQYEFVDSPALGQSEWREPQQYDAVTCMFAIHYFFVTEQALKQFLHNVSINLKDGGYFIGTVPDGKRVNACIERTKSFRSPMLTIEAHWEGQPQCFGSPYICAIGDTVTGGEKGTKGSYEYLVYSNVLVGVAAQYGLKPVLDYRDPALAALFEPGDANRPLKHFRPHFPDSDPSLARASALFTAFVFQKTSGTPAAPLLPGNVALQGQPGGAAVGTWGRQGEGGAQAAGLASGSVQRPMKRMRPGLLKPAAPRQQAAAEQQQQPGAQQAGDKQQQQAGAAEQQVEAAERAQQEGMAAQQEQQQEQQQQADDPGDL